MCCLSLQSVMAHGHVPSKCQQSLNQITQHHMPKDHNVHLHWGKPQKLNHDIFNSGQLGHRWTQVTLHREVKQCFLQFGLPGGTVHREISVTTVWLWHWQKSRYRHGKQDGGNRFQTGETLWRRWLWYSEWSETTCVSFVWQTVPSSPESDDT